MLAATTIKCLIFGFESSIAVMYVVWIRTAAAIWLLHIIFSSKSSKNKNNEIIEVETIEKIGHTNLMR